MSKRRARTRHSDIDDMTRSACACFEAIRQQGVCLVEIVGRARQSMSDDEWRTW